MTILFIPLEGGPLDQVDGLPVHPLVVHAAVVLIPLGAVLLLAALFLRRHRELLAKGGLVSLGVGTVAAWTATVSGQTLAARLGGVPDDHARLGLAAPVLSSIALAVGLGWFLMRRRSVPKAVSGTAGIGAVALAVAATVVVSLAGHSGAAAVWASKSVDPAASTPVPANVYTLSDVAQHATGTDCWSVIDGVVYNLTAWVGSHPGGPAVIEAMCGKDASAGFHAQHGTDPAAIAALKRFAIGTIPGGATAPSGSPSASPTATSTKPSTSGITLDQVAKHNSRSSCWTVVDAYVYDLTAWVAAHPGGSSTIVAMCGKNATGAYHGQHGSSAGPAAKLKTFQIGKLSGSAGASTNSNQNSKSSAPPQQSGLTMADVAKHNSRSSCWSVVDGSVYDLTGWVAAHPGGSSSIVGMCGKNGGAAFHAQHGSGGSASAKLRTFRIGALNGSSSGSAPQPTVTKTTTTKPPQQSGLTMADVAKHNSRSSCWSVVDGSVYDLTGWVSGHPGGSATILGMCGKDGSSAYHAKHGSSAAPAAALRTFRIGALNGSSGGGPTTAPPIRSITASEVRQHGTSSSCWTIVSQKVYDVTAWIGAHPGGGGAIRELCGRDGTGHYNEEHSGQADAKAMLATFQIGVLAP